MTKRKKPATATGWIYAPQAASRSDLDASSVRRWCRKADALARRSKGKTVLFQCELLQDPDDLRTRWHIHAASFMAWHRKRQGR